MQDSGTAIRHAAAQAREILVGVAAARLGVAAESCSRRRRGRSPADGRRAGYGELVADQLLHVRGRSRQSQLKPPAQPRLIGKPVPRVDIPAKVTGGAAYVQDLRLPDMVHARVVRPPSYGAQLNSVDTAAVGADARRPQGRARRQLPRRGRRARMAGDQAMRALAAAATWDETPSLPEPASAARRSGRAAGARP